MSKSIVVIVNAKGGEEHTDTSQYIKTVLQSNNLSVPIISFVSVKNTVNKNCSLGNENRIYFVCVSTKYVNVSVPHTNYSSEE